MKKLTKAELTAAVTAYKTETQEALQTVYDSLNNGQQKQIVKHEKVKMLFDRHGVKYGD